ncbi:AMP-binding enzyme [Sphingopyxis sp. PET50]|uniref:AMP-binding enzyme n=1 Tax=Sphingopyxis sp. PET50 TaxID=2976533 RepID=UPI0039195245
MLHLHPAVQQAAVVGVPHEVLGEDIAAAVTLRPGCGEATADDIIAFCKAHLGDNKVPRTLVVMDQMPLNPNGKILKKDLAEPLAKAAEARRRAA